jgi:alpha-N-acetylglucosamine transferase
MSSSLSTQGNFSYITVLSTDSYIEGVVVLYHSLMRTQPQYPFLVLTTSDLSDQTYQTLNQHGICYRPIAPIKIATEVADKQQRWQWSYTKLQVFGQVQFDKLVYLDADMMVCQNIDELFTKPHMSAVNAGGMLPENATWHKLNSGLMVIEPSYQLYDDMMAQLQSKYRVAGGDQDFLHAYYPNWDKHSELHLDHGYNLFHTHLDRYQHLFGYELSTGEPSVKVVHFIGEDKPWLIKDEITKITPRQFKDLVRRLFRSVKRRSPRKLRQQLPNATGKKLQQQALQAWLACHKAAVLCISSGSIG